MSFFEFQQPDLDKNSKHVAEYTWGEESYDGLGDALQEGGDDLNDETFGTVGAVGKDFDFSNPALPNDHRKALEASSRSHQSLLQEQAPSAGVIHDQHSVDPPQQLSARGTPQSLEAIWDNRSPFSVLPRSNGAGRSALSGLSSARSPSAGMFGSTLSSTSPAQPQPIGHGSDAGKVLSLQEMEEEMRLAAQQNRLQGTTSRQRLHQEQLIQEMRLRQQEEERYMLELAQQREQEARRQMYEQDIRVTEHDQRLLEQEQRRILQEQQRRLLLEQEQRRLLLLEQEREQLERQQLYQLQEQQRLQLQRLMQQQQQQQQQRTPPPRMLPTSQSPRFFEHQRQLLQLQQQQQEQLQMEELQRQLLNNLSLQQQGASEPRRRPAGPTDYEIQAAQLLHQQQQQQRGRRSQSPSVNQFNGSGVPQDLAPQNIQFQQRLLSEMAQAEFMREMQAATPKQLEQQEALRAEAMKKILEAEKMEERRRRKAAKIAHMSRYNDLMTQSDKDFITRIQVSQLVTQDPYADDFYAQVYGAILRSRMGLQSDERVLKFGSGGGVGLGLTSQKGYRRPSAMQRMEQQVERIVSNARKREEEKGLHSIHSLQGALGRTSGRSYKAAPRQLLQVDSTPGTSPVMTPAHAHISKPSQSKEGGAAEAAKLGRAALGDAADNENLVRREPLSHREVLTIIEALYDLILNVEQVKRDQPLPEEEQEHHDAWQQDYDALMDNVWDELRVLVPLETSDPHPFISILGPSKGKKILPRLTRHLSSQRMLTLLTLLVACFGQLDVVRNAPFLDSAEDDPEHIEVERQTNAFLASVMQSILPIVAKSNLRLITGLLGLLLDRSNVVAVARTKPGLALLTLFLSRVEVIKQSIASGTQDIAEIPTTEEAQQWSNMFNHLFDLVAPHMLVLFPSSRIVQAPAQGQQQQQQQQQHSVYDNADQYVWQFLAAFALHGSLDQHQVLVAALREKILDNLLAVSRGRFTTEEERNTKLGNVNLFLNALGLDSSQIAL
ncbi:hypothetical protein D9756_002510 [Leucocoprinus leucothites]|uniref:mRNA decay factor PAT1 domain-containing protein n=1 Tax=Leucocoprinus leucothites TaxID=201217 RepID=A0A8H5GB77_9AGAR|nr:hypothetical protein D9756_002510 [Leucoagaricus leucothites]